MPTVHMNDKLNRGFPNSTRRSILELIKRRGEVTGREVADELGMTVAGVRQQLGNCQRDGVVLSRPVRGGPGRPVLVYSLTIAGQHLFGQRYEEIALDVLNNARSIGGGDLVDRIFAERQKGLVRHYAPRTGGGDLVSKIRSLARVRQSEGFMASVETDIDGALLLVERHCPVTAVAENYPRLCEFETELFSQVLGPDVCVERTCHMLQGGSTCTFRITERTPMSSSMASIPAAENRPDGSKVSER